MVCPICKGNSVLRCIETRDAPDYVRRRRICETCGETYSTREALVEKHARLKKVSFQEEFDHLIQEVTRGKNRLIRNIDDFNNKLTMDD